MKTIILPILPGKTEAWRRCLQELDGTHRQQLEELCAFCHILNLQISLWETARMAVAIISFSEGDFGEVCWPLGADKSPFIQWLRRQSLALNGLDLTAIQLNSSSSLLLEVVVKEPEGSQSRIANI